MINNQILVLKDIEDNLDLRVVLQKSSDGFKGQFSRQLVGKVKFPSADAAKGQAFQTLFRSQFQTALIGRNQQILVGLAYLPLNNGTYGVNHIGGRQIKTPGQLGLTCRFWIALLRHQMLAGQTQLQTCLRVDSIVDTGMVGDKTAQHLAVGRIDDGIHL